MWQYNAMESEICPGNLSSGRRKVHLGWGEKGLRGAGVVRAHFPDPPPRGGSRDEPLKTSNPPPPSKRAPMTGTSKQLPNK